MCTMCMCPESSTVFHKLPPPPLQMFKSNADHRRTDSALSCSSAAGTLPSFTSADSPNKVRDTLAAMASSVLIHPV